MNIKKVQQPLLFEPSAPAKLVKMGNITELTVCSNINTQPECKKISKDCYVLMSTGEVKEYQHTESRLQCTDSLRKTLQRIRYLINANVSDCRCIRWVTLTYKENMTDTDRLYHDYEKFWKRFLYYCVTNNYKKPEYISVIEPQGRGAWHVHALFIWESAAPFIANTELANLWGHGFVSIKQPTDCDNLGAYFSGYLADMPADEVAALGSDEQQQAFVAASDTGSIEPIEKQTPTGSKKVIKGARMALYPSGLNIYRHSKGIKKPIIERTNYESACRYIETAAETYSQSFEILDDFGNSINRVHKASYNFKRKRSCYAEIQPGTS